MYKFLLGFQFLLITSFLCEVLLTERFYLVKLFKSYFGNLIL
jgi:hypothetical protein